MQIPEAFIFEGRNYTAMWLMFYLFENEAIQAGLSEHYKSFDAFRYDHESGRLLTRWIRTKIFNPPIEDNIDWTQERKTHFLHALLATLQVAMDNDPYHDLSKEEKKDKAKTRQMRLYQGGCRGVGEVLLDLAIAQSNELNRQWKARCMDGWKRYEQKRVAAFKINSASRTPEEAAQGYSWSLNITINP